MNPKAYYEIVNGVCMIDVELSKLLNDVIKIHTNSSEVRIGKLLAVLPALLETPLDLASPNIDLILFLCDDKMRPFCYSISEIKNIEQYNTDTSEVYDIGNSKRDYRWMMRRKNENPKS